MVAQAKIFVYTKFCLATLKTLSLRSIRVWKKKKRKFGVSQPIKSTSLICVNNELLHRLNEHIMSCTTLYTMKY